MKRILPCGKLVIAFGLVLLMLQCAISANAYDMAIVAQDAIYTPAKGTEVFRSNSATYTADDICTLEVQNFNKAWRAKYANFYGHTSKVRIRPADDIEITRIKLVDVGGGSPMKGAGCTDGWERSGNTFKPTFTWAGNSKTEVVLAHTSGLRFDYVEISYRREPKISWNAEVHALKGESKGVAADPVYIGAGSLETFTLTDNEGNDIVASGDAFIRRDGTGDGQIVLDPAPSDPAKTYTLTVTRACTDEEKNHKDYIPTTLTASIPVRVYSAPVISASPDGYGDEYKGDGITTPNVYALEGGFMVLCETTPCTVYLYQEEGLEMEYKVAFEAVYAPARTGENQNWQNYDPSKGIEINTKAFGQMDIRAITPDGGRIGEQSAGFSIATGVMGIDADDAGEAVWYNLQGQRVENPTSGLFIRVGNGRSEKILK